MLKLKGITKIYDVADEKVVALDGVNIELRRSEFVSILGPSGCGKTTLLNIIGGLDKYTSGSLEIDGISTAQYDDRDWDSYRNHSVGFVFQNYNLINHLTVLDNVALALTLVGEDKEKRTTLALEALGRVGLKNKALKKPNQLSGGQMQRVAIARALINNPDIILADEPTGALDSETSVHIMALLKEISKSRLVVMVTHNAELAKEYSTRIVRLFDGRVVGDTNPYHAETKGEGKADDDALRTAAEAIRFVGGALLPDRSALTDKEIRASQKAFIQEIAGRKFAILTSDKGKLIAPYTSALKRTVKCGFYEKKALFGKELAETERAFLLKKEDKRAQRVIAKYKDKPAMKAATAFKLSFTNLVAKRFRTLLTAISGSIGILGIALVLALYSGLNGFIVRQEAALASNPITITRSVRDYEAIVDAVVSSLDGLDGQYDRTQAYIYKIVSQIVANKSEKNRFDGEMIDEIKQLDRSLVYDVYMNYGFNFNVVREIPRNTKIFGTMSTGGSYYYMALDTSSYWTQLPSEELVLEQYEVIAGSYPKNAGEICVILDGRNQISDINLFFNGLDYEKVSLNYKEDDLNENSTIPVSHFVGQKYYLIANDAYYIGSNSGFKKNETESPVGVINLINSEISRRLGENSSSYKMRIWRGDKTDDNVAYTYNVDGATPLTVSGVIKLKDDVSVGVLGSRAVGYTSALTDKVIYDASNSAMVKELIASYKEKNPEAGDMELSDAMRQYSYAITPSSISIYCRNFAAKSSVKTELDKLSEKRKAEGKSEIAYSDLMSVVLNIVRQFITIITCALLSLTAISLLVSALMIGIITYVSVLERTREIGVLRALGARKIDVSRIFNAETVILGFAGGIFGVILTYILSWPLGSIMAKYTGIAGLVTLPWYFALLLIGLSVLLTLVSGLIPASMAKKKDPVKALRSE